MSTSPHSKRSYYIFTRQKSAAKLGVRFCPKCDLDKNNDEFDFPLGSRARKAWCTACRSMKICPKCNQNLPRATHFRQLKNKPNMAYCFNCQRKYNREYKYKNEYQITVLEYELMSAEQGNKCYLCGKRGKLVVDHSHLTGKVRHLLCDLCNRGLGYFKDSPEVLRAAANYVEEVSLSV